MKTFINIAKMRIERKHHLKKCIKILTKLGCYDKICDELDHQNDQSFEEAYQKYKKSDTPLASIVDSFQWDESGDGEDYWNEIYENILNNYEDR